MVVGKSQQVATDIKKPAKPADPIKIDLSEGDEAVYGRRVTVELVNQVLSLAEVEVWGEFLRAIRACQPFIYHKSGSSNGIIWTGMITAREQLYFSFCSVSFIFVPLLCSL